MIIYMMTDTHHDTNDNISHDLFTTMIRLYRRNDG